MAEQQETQEIKTLPLLAAKNSVIYPGLMMPLALGRPMSIGAMDAAMATEEQEVIVVAQKDAATDAPTSADLYTVGTRAVIRKSARPAPDHAEVLVLGVERVVLVKVEEVTAEGEDKVPYLQAKVRSLPLPHDTSDEIEALTLSIVETGSKFISLVQGQTPQEIARLFKGQADPIQLAFMVASIMNLEVAKEQALLETPTRLEAMRMVHGWLSHEAAVAELRNKISEEAKSTMSREQREYVLRQQKKAIEQELGETGTEDAEIEILKEKFEKAELPEEVRKEATRELGRLEKIPSASPEHNVIRTWLEYVLELPWVKESEDQLDLKHAREVLDEDHYGLEKVKDRIIEHLAVLKLNPGAKAPILCLVGAPGVGKTSLGQSIARALGREFERISLGGLHDESELRGHRRTYIGSMPGRLIRAMRRVGVLNPLMMLDEIDKLGRDFRGDPAAALLEILDPAQNKTFRDNYLDLPFDLSKTLFITTANGLDTVPAPLLDRMEVLQLAGYSEEEKFQIAKRYLLPRQLETAGLTAEQCNITDDSLHKLIRSYTREAGVRRLEQVIGRVVRKIAVKFAEGNTEPMTVTPADVLELLGPEARLSDKRRKVLPPGVVTGLAWTQTGGDVLYIEAAILPEGKSLTITGQLGEVMQESAKTARSYLWANAEKFGFNVSKFKDFGLHIHVPAGAIPKDGPSAGVTMTTAMASIYAGKPARSDTAMTGEVTLHGLVLPIGGVKEKVLAARRLGLTRVILPKDNEKDVKDLPEDVRKQMEFIFVETVDEVLEDMLPGLVREPVALQR